MNYRALAKYYFDLSFYNLCFSIVISFIFSIPWGLVLFATLGNLISFFAYRVFQHQEYYLYHNLGFTKTRLLLWVILVNLVITIIPLLLLLL